VRKIEKFSTQKIRILYISAGLGLGGSERQLCLTINHLDKQDFDIAVLNLNPELNYFQDYLTALSIPVIEMPPDYKSLPRRTWFIFQTLRNFQPDIVHSWNFYANAYAGITGKLARVPAQIGSQRNAFMSEHIQKLSGLHRYLSLYSVSSIVVNSRRAKTEMEQSGYPGSQIIYIPNIIDLNFKADLSSSNGLENFKVKPNTHLIGTVGNLRRQKNHLMFIEAMASVINKFPKVRGLIIGQLVPSEPKIPEQITTAISQRQLDGKVIWAGYQEGVPQILKSLTIFCLTSDYEGSPNVIVEAMATGLPIVATSVGDLPDIIKNSQQGFLVEPGDATGIARAINKLLDDPELRRKMGQAARAWVKDNTNAQAISWRFASFYRSAIKQNAV